MDVGVATLSPGEDDPGDLEKLHLHNSHDFWFEQ